MELSAELFLAFTAGIGMSCVFIAVICSYVNSNKERTTYDNLDLP